MAPVGAPCMAFQKMLNPKYTAKAAALQKSATNATKSVTAGVDAARENLERSMALAKAKKEENTYVWISLRVGVAVDNLQDEAHQLASWWQEGQDHVPARTSHGYHSINAC